MSPQAHDAHRQAVSVTHHATDPRADGARRIVHVDASVVTIERSLSGVRMRGGVPVAAYRGLVVAVQAPNGGATLSLRHDDSELDVVLACGVAEEVARSARHWSRVLGKAIVVEEACVRMRTPHRRDRKRSKPSRRSAFARRRSSGDPARAGRSFADEHEIIACD